MAWVRFGFTHTTNCSQSHIISDNDRDHNVSGAVLSSHGGMMDEMLVQLWSVEATRTTHLCRKMLTEDEDRDGARMPGAGQTCGRGWKAAGGAGLSTPCTGNNSSISQQPPAPVPALPPLPARSRSRRKTEIYPTFEQQLTTRIQFLNFDIDILMNTDTIFILLDLCYIDRGG